MKKKVLILGGGISKERLISLETAKEVFRELVVKKYKCKVVPIYIERVNDINFKLTVHEPLVFSDDQSVESITLDLNHFLEKLILKNPDQWIWSHNRWK